MTVQNDPVYTKYLEKSFVPKVPQLKAEMMQQAEEQGIKRLRKNSVLKPDAIAWLKEHLVIDLASVDYLLKTAKALYKTMLKMAAKSEASELANLATTNWDGLKPWLCLYLCATNDCAIEALKVENDCMDRDKGIMRTGLRHMMRLLLDSRMMKVSFQVLKLFQTYM